MRLAAYQPDIPQNLGAMIRLSACFGVPLDVIEPCGFPFSIKSLRRAAMDYANLADVTQHTGWEAFLETTGRRPLVLFTTESSCNLWDFNFAGDEILLVGRESAGVPADVHQRADVRLRLPMKSEARSLNVSMAAAIGLSEALRQTGYWTKTEHSGIGEARHQGTK